MTTFPILHSNPKASFAYWGENEGWYMVFSRHRDSDTLERANWDVMSVDMLARFPDDVRIESFTNWAVGWSLHLLVRPGSPAVKAAEEYIAKLDEYPVLDEDLYSRMEADEEWCVRCDRGIAADHPLRGCKFRSESDADNIRFQWQERRRQRIPCRICGERPSSNPSFYDLHKYGPLDHDYTP